FSYHSYTTLFRSNLNEAVLDTAFARLVGSDGLQFALAFRVDAVGVDAEADQVGLDRSGTTLGQTLVVLFGTDRVGVADGDDGLEVDALGLLSDLLQQLAAFRLQGRLVEVEEGVGIEDNLGGHGRRLGGGRLSNGNAVAAGDAGGGGPEGVAPAQFIRAVHPHVAERIAPVVHGLRGSCTGSRNGGEGERQSEFGGFVHVSPR